MNGGWGQIVINLIVPLVASGFGIAIVQGIFNKKNLKADTADKITTSADRVIERLEKENVRLTGDNTKLNERMDTLEGEADRHKERDRLMTSAIRAHEAFDRDLIARLESLGVTDLEEPPPLVIPDAALS